MALNEHAARRNAPAPRVLLSSRNQIAVLGADLASVAGSQELVKMIKDRKKVTHLELGHNNLGDDGCQALFAYLRSDDGQRHKVAEMCLKSNNISDPGLECIAEYIQGDEHLRVLRLQNNVFKGNLDVTSKFTRALNSSHISLLSLATNIQLSDAFLDPFLSQLDAVNLRSLDLSATGLTPLSTPSLVAFITSPRASSLETLKLSANNFDAHSVRSVIAAVESKNFALLQMEIFANDYGAAENQPEDNSGGQSPHRSAWQRSQDKLSRVLLRNKLLKSKTQDSAIRVLPFARALLLQPRRDAEATSHWLECVDSEASSEGHRPSASTSVPSGQPPNTSHPRNTIFPFCHLPTELQLHILTFLAPLLSSAQIIRIFKYASTPDTLPALLQRLPGPGCIPDPSSLTFGAMLPRAGGCGGGQCMGAGNSVLCHRTKMRERWLAEVGCERFEAGDIVDVDFLLDDRRKHSLGQS